MATEGVSREPVRARSASFAEESPLTALLAPSLLRGLDADDDRTTHTAGYGLYLLARADEDAPRPLADALARRLVVDDSRRDVRRTLASLRLVADEAVREALLDATAHDQARRRYAVVRETDPWSPPDPLPADGDHAEYLTAFRQLVQPEDDDPPEREERSVTRVIEDDEDDDTAGDDTADDEEDEDERIATAGHSDEGGESRRDRIERLSASETVTTLVHRSGFDELQVLTPRRERRFADVFRARARADDTERGVSVRLLRADDAAGLDDTLGSWARLVEADGVVTVVDWGTTPRPWLATDCVEGRLADRGRVDPAWALRTARRLAGALAELHGQDVVHAGIDPHSVVYTSTVDGDAVAMLDNVGLLQGGFDPADYLDPRYAAPEYFDDSYGRVDAATDIYQLGMVVYRLCAGRHPFDGSHGEVRTAVLNDRPPAPSRCTPGLPEAVDDVVAKATATQKLTRYETAHGLHRDLARICDAVLE